MLSFKRRAIALVVTTAAVGAAVAQLGTAAVSCVPKKNIELILDDSGSMGGTDFNKLRVQGSKLLLEKPANQNKTFGAVQFGDASSTVFAPGVVAANKATMEAALDAQINADDGTTNYNAAFDKAKADNPNADSRIFLTDGGHNVGNYAEGHQGGPRTDVVGFGSSTVGEDGARLARIASDTGGIYYPQTDASTLQATMNEIDAALNCLPKPTAFKDQFIKANETKSHAVSVRGSTRSLEVVLSWSNPQDVFDLVNARQGRAASVSKRKQRKPKITRTRGTTFVSAKISRLRKGRLKFKVKAKKLTLPTTLTTQVTQSKKR